MPSRLRIALAQFDFPVGAVEANADHYITRLDAEAPDLAAQVREERLSMREAWAGPTKGSRNRPAH